MAKKQTRVTSRARKPWGFLLGAAKAVQAGTIDGFFVPYQSGFRIPKKWPNGTIPVLYKCKAGWLVFKKGAYKKYGYAEEKDFATAALRGKLTAKTPNGIVSIGSLRECAQKFTVLVRASDISCDLLFRCESSAEAGEVAILCEKLFPKESIRTGATAFLAALSYMPRLNVLFEKINRLPKRKRDAIILLWVGAVAGCLMVALPWVSSLPFLLTASAPLVFAMLAVPALKNV